jgi:hypothetical protein
MSSDWQLLTEQETADKCRLSVDTLQRYRSNKVLIQGIHWQRLPGGNIRYHEGAMFEWYATLHDERASQRAIEAWQQQLLSNKKGKKRRNSTPVDQATLPVPSPPPNNGGTASEPSDL